MFQLHTMSQYHFFIKCDNSMEKVYYQDLLSVEGLLNYVILYTVSRKMVVFMTIKSILEQLPKELFIKVHKSHIVNIDKIKSIEGNSIRIGNSSITISQLYREESMKMILRNNLIKR
jgi:DNA-binding LytR/AlgR family response regulator